MSESDLENISSQLPDSGSGHFIADTSKVFLVNDTDEPLEEHHDAHKDHPHNSLTRTFINFIKGNLGTGILALPDAIKNGGLFLGPSLLMLLGALSTYCCHQLLQAYVRVSHGKPMAYAPVVETVFRKAGGRWRRMSKGCGLTIQIFLVVTQIGFCCVYVLFIAQLVKEVVDGHISGGSGISIQGYETILLIFLIPYSFVTTLKALSLFSLIANVIVAFTIVVVVQFEVRNLQPIEDVDWTPSDIATLPLFFGTAMYSFEAIGLILPIENRMEDRDAFHHWNGLLSASMGFVICLFVAVGFYGYLAFGSGTQMILSNLPPGNLFYDVTKILYAMTIFISYNLQLYVPVQILFPRLKRMVRKHWFDKYGEYIFRVALVLLTYGLAAGVPCLEYMISLVGASFSSGLALIFPPVVEMVSCYIRGERHRLTWYMVVKNFAICAIGIFGSILGTYVALENIITALSSPQGCQ